MQIVEAKADWLVQGLNKDMQTNALINAMCARMHRDGQPMPVVVDDATCRVLAGASAVEAAVLLEWDDEGRMLQVALHDGSPLCSEIVCWWRRFEQPVTAPDFPEGALEGAIRGIEAGA
jgi:hypothetical protein